MAIGCMVTLRGRRMYEFLDRLISLALPRVRDFRGLSPKAFDGNGNYSLGLSEQLVFPELNPDKFTRPQGMNITIVTNCGSNDDARELLAALGVPFRGDQADDAPAKGKKK
jgi:large subunit ribosomal protein L5